MEDLQVSMNYLLYLNSEQGVFNLLIYDEFKIDTTIILI